MRITEYKAMLNTDQTVRMEKAKAVNYVSESMTSPREITDMLNTVFRMNEMAEEYAYLLALNTKNRVLGVCEVSHGGVDYALLNPREVFMRALLLGAVSIVVAHNHPSGDPSPSRADIDCCERLKNAGKLLGVELLDFLVIAGGEYRSFRAEGICL